MDETESPMAALSAAVVRMTRELSRVGAPVFGRTEAAPSVGPCIHHDALARDVALCIENLQFHDRLIQQLTQVREVLTGLAANRLLATLPAKPAKESSIELF
jgi:hypothetical protein